MGEPEHAAVGRRLRRIRYEMGDRSQADFGADLGGFSQTQVGFVEAGRNLPTTKMLAALAERGVDVNWLLTGEGTAGGPAANRGIPVLGATTAGLLAEAGPGDEGLGPEPGPGGTFRLPDGAGGQVEITIRVRRLPPPR